MLDDQSVRAGDHPWRFRPDGVTLPSFRRLKLWTKRGLAAFATLSTVFVATIVAWDLAGSVGRKNHLTLIPISVPKALADDGYTGAVVTQRLLDEITAIQKRANFSQAKLIADARPDMSSVTIPTVGVSIETLASSIRGWLPSGWTQEISGEFTMSGGKPALLLRLNGRTLALSGGAADDVDGLIRRGAFAVIKATQQDVAAAALYGGKDFDGAWTETVGVIDTAKPGDEKLVWAHILRGLIAEERKRDEEAERELRTAVRLDPGLPQAHGLLGLFLQNKGRVAEALAEYRTILRLVPTHAGAHYTIARVLRQQGRTEAAMEELNAILALNPDYDLAHRELGDIWRDQGQPERAIAAYRAALRADPKDVGARISLGRTLDEQKKRDDALVEYRAALDQDPGEAAGYLNLGNLLWEQGKVDEAATQYRRVLELGSLQFDAHHGLGLLAADRREFEAAELEYRTALGLAPKTTAPHDLASTHNALANALIDEGRTDEGIAEYQESVRIDPTYSIAHYNLGNQLRKAERLDDAEAEYRAAIRLDPSFANPHLNLGVILRAESKLADAGAEYDAAVRLDPTLAAAHYNRGNVWKDVAALAAGTVRSAMLRQACAEYVRANELVPADQDSLDAIKQLDGVMQGTTHCPPD